MTITTYWALVLSVSAALWMTTPALSAATDPQTGLPPGSELDDEATENPREVFHSESLHGRKSYLSKLGNLAFNSPLTLGAAARKAGISCATCHVNGASNPRFFVPGLSTHPGNFDTTSAFFNPKADNGVLDPAAIPSLRGARYLAPYGHDGRIASLKEFTLNVIVNEFAGAEPSAEVLDALVVYLDDIDFLPNTNLDRTNHLRNPTEAQRRGEVLFAKPFPRDPNLSCAACHVAASAFADHQVHDVGSGGLFKTPTLLNADFNPPYFHDGRFDELTQVIEYFDSTYALALSAQDRADLLAYLAAIGDGVRPQYHLTGSNVLADINDFVSVLDIAIAERNQATVSLVAADAADLLEGLAARYPEAIDAHAAGSMQRAFAREALAALAKNLQRVGSDAAASRFDSAAADYLAYRRMVAAAAPLALQAAEPFSLFNPAVRLTDAKLTAR